MGMDEKKKELAKVIEKYFGADAAYLDISCFDLAMVIIEAGWTKPVRCKDCKSYELQYYACGPEMGCTNSKAIWTSTPPDAFCSYGERREGG